MSNQHSNGALDFANMAICTDLLSNAWDAIPEVPDSPSPVSVTFKVSSEKEAMIIAFVSSPAASTLRNLRQGEEGEINGLIDSSDTAFPLFEFVRTKVNRFVSINKAAIEQFASLYDQLSALKDQIDVKRPLIITGLSLGGSIASLFTLWLLDTIYLKTSKFPICITFGSPLLGDNAFEQAISERPTWISCFLHVIFNQDPVPKYLVSSGYMPFGTYLFLSESGCACFDEPTSVLELLKSMSLRVHEDLQIIDYGGILKRLKYNAIRKEKIEEVDECDISYPLRAEFTLQLLLVGAIGEENFETGSFISEMEKRLGSFRGLKKNIFDYTKKLTEMKVNMAQLEWYMKVSKKQGGYYDCYKYAKIKSAKEVKRKEEIVLYQRRLTHCWKHMVEEIERMPKREGASMIRPRFLHAGTNYRRMVEPLDIAEYYGKGETDYINKGRSEHYKLLEQWEKSNSSNKPAERTNVASMTEDSCFWAHVEEAILVLRLLTDGDGSNRASLRESLVEFERYVMGLIRKLSSSTDTLEEESSFMKWWKDYKHMNGISYKSDLTAFMNNEKVESELIMLDEYKKLSSV